MQAASAQSAQSGQDRTILWRRFFNLGLRVLGIGLLASGIVTWIAANWDGLSKFERIAGVQLLLVGAVAVALVLAWRGPHRSGQAAGTPTAAGSDSQGIPAFAGALFLATVVTGGLLALLGQTYQTGADPWTLFGWWALLTVPWLLVARSWFVIVLWLVVANTAVILLLGTEVLLSSQQSMLMSAAWVVAGLNIVLLAVAEWLRGRYGDPYRVVPRLLVLAILIALFGTLVATLDSLFGGHANPGMPLQVVFVGAVVAGGFHFYRRVRPDFFILSQLAVFTVLYAGTYALIASWLSAESIELSVLLAFVVALGGLLGCVSWLRRVYQAQFSVPDQPAASDLSVAQPAAVTPTQTGAAHTESAATSVHRSPLLFLISFGFIFLLGLALIAVLEIPLTVAAGVVLVVGLLAYFARGGAWRVSGATLLLVGLLLLAFEVFSGSYFDYDNRSLPLLGLVAGLLLLYHMHPIAWFQFMCAVAALVLFALLWPQYSPGWALYGGDQSLGYYYDVEWQVFMTELAPLYLVLATWMLLRLSEKWQRRYKALAWALLCVPLCGYVFQMSGTYFGLSHMAAGGRDLLALLLAKWRLPAPLPFVYASNVVLALLPVVVGWVVARRHQVPAAEQVLMVLVLLGLGLLWGGLHGVQLGLLLCLLGYALRYRSMLVLGILSIMLFLAAFYFQLHFLLLDKAYFLMGQGVVLLVIALLWRRLWRSASQVEQQPDPSGRLGVDAGSRDSGTAMRSTGLLPVQGRRGLSATVLAGILVGLVAVLAAANADIMQKEAIIRDGTRFVVALRPVDPRSLMQGDYMALNFVSGWGEGAELFNDYSHHYVELTPDAQGVHHFTRTLAQMETPAPQSGKVVVRYRRQLDKQLLFVTDAYFFPEGQGEHFAQARYGEFRVNKDGVALLVGLLDEQQNRL
ncbi:GDYXXLXY domain-containing protein [Advenella mimigardefordensis]|uniref:Putative membrane protein n=1 Tax=Advenella mimigardefordensis (strain DSM 17166 / LMG 22922 / DPN7) TaxID=1247726 RepID=W0P6D6_ADVMD|nr:GDYXXLXY domain-containing protein [Advenella mimigardefordensis]AHG62424.1 putative membrane protein [Advenella mimigardefordensis DPN7]